MIDNFDSFTYNIVEEFARRNCRISTYRNSVSQQRLREIVEHLAPQLIVLSPGPGHPTESGICIQLVREYHGRIPIVGVCLGHQAIVVALGGEVSQAPEVVHGKSSLVYHRAQGLLHGLPSPLTVGRYHSLCATALPRTLEASARTEDDIVMAVRSTDRQHTTEGLQFHPESVMSTLGGRLIENMISIALENTAPHRAD